MAQIKLDESWYIDNSNSTATLVNETVGEIHQKTGKPTISKDVFYYSTVKQALLGYTNRSLIHNETIEEILKKINKVEETIKNLNL